MRVVLKGIDKVKRRLASGETKVHFYAWRGGPAIQAKPGTPEFVRAYNEAHTNIRQPARHVDDHHRRVQGIARIYATSSIKPGGLTLLHRAD